MKMRLSLVLLCLIAWANPGVGQAGASVDYREPLSTGCINWTTWTVTAKGVGSLQDATDNALLTVYQVRMDADSRLVDLIKPKLDLRLKVGELAAAAVVIDQKTLPTGDLEVTVQMALSGGFAQLVLPTEIKQVESIKPLRHPQGNITSAVVASNIAQAGTEPDAFTGLIVDARGIGAKPAMVPVLLDENGEEVYSPAFVSREFAVQQGVCQYMSILGDSANLVRVAPKPLLVKGLRTRVEGGCDIVISNADASRLRGVSSHLSFLKQCRVIILMD
jgi:hypothetical protein